ncbi:hypothetical protein SSEA_SKINNY_152 [Mycobacterium phage Skinny]|nr:hypothetical protein SSEA_SKINNY_152 [Mycobacterium phage Skinny]WNN95724.1 hypothetical protein SEA_GLASKE16_148 [Mycobacterium phage Glaske16]WNN96299.1 hypothetical protein SEA_DULCITA_146 [Mycobacterium phage Dulcita]WNO28244.1 hypothetical protein SEA_DIMINIMUS_146 [Mycobacterium phage Diminimus]
MVSCNHPVRSAVLRRYRCPLHKRVTHEEGKRTMGSKIAHALIGNTAKRDRWIGQTDGTLPTYEGPIPVAEVERRLFNWEAISVPTGNFIPVGVDQLGEPGVIVLPDGRPARVVITEGAQGIVRSDDYTELGRHTKSYRIHDYKEWLIRNVSNILQDRLSILSALTLKNGAQAAVEIGLDETMHDEKTGLEFWPFLLAQTSLDGSIATTYSAFNRMLICDNMFQGIRADARKSGRQYKVKHTVNSMSAQVVAGVREALSILDKSAHEMQDFTRELAQIEVTRKEWLKVLDIIEPPAPADSSKAKITKAENRREALDHYYTVDPMSAPFAGTAFGVVQAVNTYEHHGRSVRGTSRLERVYDRAIRGDIAASDGATLGALAKVLDMPELIPA